MLARVGDEHNGRFLRETLNRAGVDTEYLITDKSRLTALVMLGIKDQETFPLIFYRDNCADMALTPDDISEEYIASSRALAVTGTLAGERLSKVLKRFARRHPDVALTLRTATSAEVSDQIRRGEATIGLRYDRDRSGDLECEVLFAEPLQVVCAPDHPLAGRRVGRLADLRDERWIAFPEVPGRREITASHVFALFLTHGLGEVAWTPVDSLTAQKRLVEAGLGIALLSHSNAAEELRTSAIATIRVGNLTASHEVVAVTRHGGFLSAASRRLLDIIRADFTKARGTNASRRNKVRRA